MTYIDSDIFRFDRLVGGVRRGPLLSNNQIVNSQRPIPALIRDNSDPVVSDSMVTSSASLDSVITDSDTVKLANAGGEVVTETGEVATPMHRQRPETYQTGRRRQKLLKIFGHGTVMPAGGRWGNNTMSYASWWRFLVPG